MKSKVMADNLDDLSICHMTNNNDDDEFELTPII